MRIPILSTCRPPVSLLQNQIQRGTKKDSVEAATYPHSQPAKISFPSIFKWLQPAAALSSTVTTAVLVPGVHAAVRTTHCSALPSLPRVSTTSSFSSSVKLIPESKRFSLVQTKATDDTSVDTGELFTDLKEKWDNVENKSTVVVYGGGAVVAVWLSSIVVGAINSVPLFPKIMELVGLGYTGWFVYRYLLFKSSRKELATDIEVLKKKIAGTE